MAPSLPTGTLQGVRVVVERCESASAASLPRFESHMDTSLKISKPQFPCQLNGNNSNAYPTELW